MRSVTAPIWLGLVALVVVGVAVPVVVARHGSSSVAAVRVAPLTAPDRRVLEASKPLIAVLPTALAQVPGAASDAAGGAVSPGQAAATIASVPALGPLARAIGSPASATASLVEAYSAVLSGKRPAVSADQLSRDLTVLQTVEGDVVPAVRYVAAKGHHQLNAAAALTAVERDPKQRDLATLLAGWQQFYGTFTLVEQAAAS